MKKKKNNNNNNNKTMLCKTGIYSVAYMNSKAVLKAEK